MADRIGMALRLAKEGRTEGFQYLYEYTVEKQLGKAIALMGDIGQAQSLQILQEHETSIKAYNQYRQTLGVDDFVSDNENMSIALSDVTGDGVPELLFVEKSPSSEEYVEYDALNIFTVENGAAKQIYYADHWETQVAGGNVYSLFQVEGESTLYSCNGMQDESTFEDYCRYVVQPDGTLQEESLMSRKREPNEDYSVFFNYR